MDLDRFFTLGHEAPFRANDVFVDRESHLDAYHERARQHVAQSWDVPGLMNFSRPARNVMTFVGDGGIGKSTLGRHLASVSLLGDLAGLPEKRVAIVIDFADAANLGFETVLLRIRAALGALQRSWPAFDIALSVYWDRKYPGESFSDHLRRLSSTGEVGQRLAEQVASTVDQLLLGGLGATNVLYHLASLAGRAVTRNVTLRRIHREQPAFEMLIEEKDPDRMLGYLPILLASDLARVQDREPGFALCILDTFENVQVLPPSTGGLEDLICRLVYLVPNMFFICSSRRPLRWHDPVRSVGLTYGSERRWPGLVIGAEIADQHTVAGLNNASAESYLLQRLTRDGQPAIPPVIRERIAKGAAGSPLYLQLSVNLFEQIVARGETPTADMFGSHFPELVLRIMRDLSERDRDLLRAAALLQAFDAEILQAILPDIRSRYIETFLGRSFVAHQPDVWPAYRIHENLRHAVLACDQYTDDGWARDEVVRNVTRAIDHLENFTVEIWNDDDPSGQAADERGRRAAAAFLLTFNAAADHSLLPPRLDVAAYTMRELGHLSVLGSLPAESPGWHPDLGRLAGVARLSSTDVDSGARYIEMKAIAGDLGQGMYTVFIELQLGHLALLAGKLDEADRHLNTAVEHRSIIGLGAFFLAGGIALRRSQFSELDRFMNSPPAAHLNFVQYLDLVGHVQMHNGLFVDAAESFATTLRHAQLVSAPLWISRASRHLALATMWCDPDQAAAILPEARDLNQALGDAIGIAQCDIASALVRASQSDWSEALRLVDQAKEALHTARVTFDLFPIEPVEVLVNLAAGNPDRARAVGEALVEAERAGRPAGPPVWTAVTSMWLGEPDWHPFETIDWISPVDARERWLSPLTRLRGGSSSAH